MSHLMRVAGCGLYDNCDDELHIDGSACAAHSRGRVLHSSFFCPRVAKRGGGGLSNAPSNPQWCFLEFPFFRVCNTTTRRKCTISRFTDCFQYIVPSCLTLNVCVLHPRHWGKYFFKTSPCIEQPLEKLPPRSNRLLIVWKGGLLKLARSKKAWETFAPSPSWHSPALKYKKDALHRIASAGISFRSQNPIPISRPSVAPEFRVFHGLHHLRLRHGGEWVLRQGVRSPPVVSAFEKNLFNSCCRFFYK